MKKIVRSRMEYFKPTVLYFDDLEKIVEILRDVSKEIKITTSEYEMENLDEIKKLNKESLNYLEIKAKEPWLEINIDFSNLYLYIGEDNAVSRGIFEKIKKILKDRERKFGWFRQELFEVPLLFVFLFGLVFGISRKNIFLIMIGVLFLLLFVMHQGLSIKARNIIHLKRKTESKSFWKRKKDEIIIAIISAIIGSIIAILSMKIFQFL